MEQENKRLWENFNELERSAVLGYTLYLQKTNPKISLQHLPDLTDPKEKKAPEKKQKILKKIYCPKTVTSEDSSNDKSRINYCKKLRSYHMK